MKKLAILFLLTFPGLYFLHAQQLPCYTQYSMNKFMLNPAAAGVDGFTTVNLVAREQWAGFKGTPKTHAISIDSRILGESYILKKLSIRKKKPEKTRSGNTSWGAYFFSDLNGPIDRTGINGTYAYHINLGEAQLSFGLSLIFFQQRIQKEQFVLSDDTYDGVIVGGKQWITDANFGAYYTTKTYYAGYSALQLFNSGAQFGDKGEGEYKVNRQHDFIGGYRFDVGSKITLEPSFLLKIPEKGITQFDISVKCNYEGKYWAGLNYRTRSTFSIFGGLNYDRYYFGYAFDYNFNDLMPNTFGSHEIMVSARFGDAARRYKWLNTY